MEEKKTYIQKHYEENEINVQKVNSPLMVAVDITNKCNLRCLHCFNNSGEGRNNELRDDELLELMDQIIEVSPLTVCLCGGEPLIRPIIYELIKKLSNKVGSVNMVSNGYFLTEEVAKKLTDAGLDLLQISLDGVSSMQHDTLRGKRGAFEKAINAIQHVKKYGIKVATSLVPNKLNHLSIEEYCDFCKDLGVSETRIMPFIPMGRGRLADFLLLNSDEYIGFQQKLQYKKDQYKFSNFQIQWGDPIDHLLRMPVNHKVGMKAYAMEVKSDGAITVSTYLPIMVGNIRENTLKEYWNSGYADIWGNKNFLKYVNQIESIYDFDKMEPRPYTGKYINLELIK